MLNLKNKERCSKILQIYPKQNQLLLSMEESSEFSQAISKYIRYGDTEPLLEEYTDLMVMMEQIRQLFKIKKKEVNKRAKKKLIRALGNHIIIKKGD